MAAENRQRGARARLRRIALRLAAIGFGLVLALVVVEIAMRAFQIAPLHRNPLSGFHDPDRELGWIGSPSYEARFRQPEFDVTIAHDASGFRRPARPFEGPADAPRAVFLGDSYTWGWGVDHGEVFTDRLQAQLGSSVRVVNRGVNAFGTTQQLLLLERDVLGQSPAYVVVMFFPNDAFDSVDDKDGGRPFGTLEDGELVIRNSPVRTSFAGWFKNLRRSSVALTTLNYQVALLSERWRAFRRGPTVARAAEKSQAASGWAVTSAVLAEIGRRCAAHEPPIELRVVYIPTPFDVSGDPQRRQSELPEGLADDLAQTCRDVGARYLDLTDAFRAAWRDDPDHGEGGIPYYFARDGHWTARGHQLAADELHRAWSW